MRYLFNGLPRGVYFSLFGMENRSLHDLIRENLVGGPSVVFHRYHKKNKTHIRGSQLGDQARLCKRILGFDANALYLFSLMKSMPTGRIILRRAENLFRAEKTQKYGYAARKWLEWLMRVNPTLDIRHQFNGGEKTIGVKQIPVDGWDKETGTVFQFHGCYWHGHDCKLGIKRPEKE